MQPTWIESLVSLTLPVGRFPVGIWLALIAISLLFVGWAVQAYSLLDWDGAVDLGFQNERFDGDPVEQAWALESWGVAMADMLWPLPLGIVALIGIWRKRFSGLAAGLMELSIGVYFPLFFGFQRWSTFRETAVLALLLWVGPSLLGILGLWANRDFFES